MRYQSYWFHYYLCDRYEDRTMVGRVWNQPMTGQTDGTANDFPMALMALKGVGKKVANCVSLFGLHHINAFPRDVWINRILENEYPEGYPFAAYSPYNGIFQQYMFAYYRNSAAESAKEKEA